MSNGEYVECEGQFFIGRVNGATILSLGRAALLDAILASGQMCEEHKGAADLKGSVDVVLIAGWCR